MANFTITISNSVNLFGQSPASLWNQYNWGSFKWGEGTATIIWGMENFISETLSPTDAIVNLDTIRLISESLTPLSETISESLLDGSGYSYVFPSNTNDSELRARASYTSGSAVGSTWNSVVIGSTTWS